MELELRQLEVAEAKARMLLLNPIDEENPQPDGDVAENDVDDGNIQLKKAMSASAAGEMIDFAAIPAILDRSNHSLGGSRHVPREEAPWRAMLDDEDIVEAPRSYSMPSFKKDINKAKRNQK